MTVCISEDRPANEVAVRLLLLSLARWMPGRPIHLRFPPASHEFKRWLSRFPHLQLQTTPSRAAKSWDVKPHELLAQFEKGASEAVWIDSDIILSGDPSPIFRGLAPECFAIAEEPRWAPLQGRDYRARAWGLPLGRQLRCSLNSGVIRATPFHIPLLRAWIRLMETDEYRRWQARPGQERPMHAMGDQEVLCALLGSSFFSHIPLRLIKRGVEIAQLAGPSGYTPAERLRSLFHQPCFVHAMANKPWLSRDASPSRRNWRTWLDALSCELSPYSLVASRYQHETGFPLPWLKRKSVTGRILGSSDGGILPMRGWLPCLLDTCLNVARHLFKTPRASEWGDPVDATGWIRSLSCGSEKESSPSFLGQGAMFTSKVANP